MQNFIYTAPTKIIFGKDTELEAGTLIKELGFKKVLLHYGSKSAETSGLLSRIGDVLRKEGIAYVPLGGVVPNPQLGKVYEGIELCKRENVDFILAVGGGSVIDSAKAIAYGLANDFDVWEIFQKTKVPTAFFPMGSVLTIAATGSETSNSTVITKEEGLLKRGYNDDIARPLFAILNPELTYTLPQYQTMSGCVDILMHTLERYFTVENDTLCITDRMSEALMRTVMENSHILMREPENYKARAEVMWAGSLSHIGLMQCGGTAGDWACHRLEHELGGLFNVAHGAGIAAIWGSWARYVYKNMPQRFAQLAVNVLDVQAAGQEETAMKGIEAMEAYFRSIGMPTNIHELGIDISNDEIETMVQKCVRSFTTLGEIMVLNEEHMRNIFMMAR